MKPLFLAAGLVAAILMLPASASATPAFYCTASQERGALGESITAHHPPPGRNCEDDTETLPGGLFGATTDDWPRRPTAMDAPTKGSQARASINAVSVNLQGLFVLEITALSAQVDTTCGPTPADRPTNTGSGSVGSLTLGMVDIPILGTPNQVVPIPLVGTLTVNYENETGSGNSQADPKIMTRQAIRLDPVTEDPMNLLAPTVAQALGDPAVVAEATSGFEGVQNPCDIPIPAGE